VLRDTHMTLYRVKAGYEDQFAKASEVFPDVHLGSLNDHDPHWCMVVGCSVVVIPDRNLSADLQDFYSKTWQRSYVDKTDSIVSRYNGWLHSLKESGTVTPYSAQTGKPLLTP
jgi:hypothetical protein